MVKEVVSHKFSIVWSHFYLLFWGNWRRRASNDSKTQTKLSYCVKFEAIKLLYLLFILPKLKSELQTNERTRFVLQELQIDWKFIMELFIKNSLTQQTKQTKAKTFDFCVVSENNCYFKNDHFTNFLSENSLKARGDPCKSSFASPRAITDIEQCLLLFF